MLAADWFLHPLGTAKLVRTEEMAQLGQGTVTTHTKASTTCTGTEGSIWKLRFTAV